MKQPRGLREVEEELRIRFGGRPVHEHSPLRVGEFASTSSLQRLLRRFGAWGRRSGRGPGSRGAGGTGNSDARQQRVVNKASYSIHHQAAKARGVLRAHVSYLVRASASADGEPGRFYDARSADAGIAGAEGGQRFRQEQWEKDRQNFRLIISPERGDLIQPQPGGMSRFIRELLIRMEKDLGAKLQWIAIAITTPTSLSARSMETQVSAKAWTWLDRQVHLRSQGKPTAVPAGGAWEQIAKARQQPVKHGYAGMQSSQYVLRSGATEELRQKEWQAAASMLIERFGRTPQPLTPGAEVKGTYRGTIGMHSGLYAAVAGRSEVYLAPVGRVPPLSYEATVRVGVDTRGRAVLTAVAAHRASSQGLERD